jgi:hypothetical protein
MRGERVKKMGPKCLLIVYGVIGLRKTVLKLRPLSPLFILSGYGAAPVSPACHNRGVPLKLYHSQVQLLGVSHYGICSAAATVEASVAQVGGTLRVNQSIINQ